MSVRDAVTTAVGVGSVIGSLIALPIWGACVTGAAITAMLALPLPRVRRQLFACAAALLVAAAGAVIVGTTRAADDGVRSAIIELRRQRDAAPIRTEILEYANGERLASGSAPLTPDDGMEQAAQAVARRDAVTGRRDVGSVRMAILDMGWNRVGESVARARTWEEVSTDVVDEPHQHAVITSKDFTHIGIGVAFDGDGTIWIHAIVVS
jgi:uncharacterized protein YkwD